MELQLSQATASDIDGMAALLHELFSQELEFAPDAEKQKKALTLLLESNQAMLFVANADSQVIGMVTLQTLISTALGEEVAILEDMIVSRNFRRQKIGEALLEYAIKSAKEHGIKRITLLTDVENLKGQEFYQKMGFKKSSMIPMRRFL